jgi:ABC-2 type transport system ATP-binding protein
LSRPTLDDVFLTLTGRSLRDDSPGAPEDEAGEAGELAGAGAQGGNGSTGTGTGRDRLRGEG